VTDESGFEAQAGGIIMSGYSGVCYALRLNSRTITEGSTMSSCNFYGMGSTGCVYYPLAYEDQTVGYKTRSQNK